MYMLSQAATRTTTSLVARRGFHATRARMSSPYHYPEGPYTNIPFNPRKKGFAFKFFAFVFTGFMTPFGIAGACFTNKASFSRLYGS
ncbi:putative cytochrome c subunit [Paramyrothecium foliicola]|nr:putative cytochrome c subunit [Paramyrothecium foliicola]